MNTIKWQVPVGMILTILGFIAWAIHKPTGMIVLAVALFLAAWSWKGSDASIKTSEKLHLQGRPQDRSIPEMQMQITDDDMTLSNTIRMFEEQPLVRTPDRQKTNILTSAVQNAGFRPEDMVVETSPPITLRVLCQEMVEIADAHGDDIPSLALKMADMLDHIWEAAEEACDKYNERSQIVAYIARSAMVKVSWFQEEK